MFPPTPSVDYVCVECGRFQAVAWPKPGPKGPGPAVCPCGAPPVFAFPVSVFLDICLDEANQQLMIEREEARHSNTGPLYQIDKNFPDFDASGHAFF